MFLKLKVEGSDKITKVKYEGQKLNDLKELIARKLDLQECFDINYIDDAQDLVSIRDDDDWELCKDTYQELSKSTAGNPSNVSLIIKLIPGTSISKPQTVSQPEEQPKFCAKPGPNHYPTPPIVQQAPTITMTPVSPPAPVFQTAVSDYVSTLFGPRGAPSKHASVTHENIACDECRIMPIVGLRYKAVNVNDFDLCDKCANLDKYATTTLIRIPYHSKQENQTGYSTKEFPQIVKAFSKFIKEPISQETVELIKKLKEVFVDADDKKIEGFVKKHQGKAFQDLYVNYIKEFHC